MGRIRILPDQVANKIAAGEVVERPASVVKELLENSLDAGATDVRIEVESGGRRLIRIVDDGCGMLRDDALLAFERHATSKLRDVKDLLSISTLGFRGEALPSIASVSRLLLETRSAEETTGTRIEIAGGKMLRCEEAALGGGTAITVRDLFYNVPARRKFLRTEPTELAHIASLVTHYSLAHPDKTFRLIERAHGAAARHARGHACKSASTRYSAARCSTSWWRSACASGRCSFRRPAYRPRRPSPSTAANPDEPPTRLFRLSGFFSRPQVQKGNRNSIYIFVNGRLIRDRLLLHALSSAYHNLMPAAAYPFALLFLECDAEEVDVNVHPSKTEVRFRHGSRSCTISCATRSASGSWRAAPRRRSRPRTRADPRRKPARAPAVLRIQPDDGERSARGAQPCRGGGRSRPVTSSPAARRRAARVHAAPHRRPPPAPGFQRAAARSRPGPPPSGKLSRHLDSARRISAGRHSRRPRCRSRCCPICARWARFTRASSLPPAATACGSSTSTWRTSASCSSR